jgi:hypothetical protein|tara:strand:+ start:178 stop:396 length:219 start_codon:yes stop_codon:yes gene_type:complete
MMNSGREWDWMDASHIVPSKTDDEIQIEEILTEANAYSLREEVTLTANTFMKEDPDLDRVLAYEMAYMEWIK